LTASLRSNASSSICHDSARLAFSRDNRVSPKPSSTTSIATLTWSPIFNLHSPRSSTNCDLGITPSDLSAACTTTHSASMSTTVPVTIEHGAIPTDDRLSSNNFAKLSLMNSLCQSVVDVHAAHGRAPVVSRHAREAETQSLDRVPIRAATTCRQTTSN